MPTYFCKLKTSWSFQTILDGVDDVEVDSRADLDGHFARLRRADVSLSKVDKVLFTYK